MISPTQQMMHLAVNEIYYKELIGKIKKIVQEVQFQSNSYMYVKAIGEIDKLLEDE